MKMLTKTVHRRAYSDRVVRTGTEWKSEATLLGLPLIHVALGRSEENRLLVARGIVAIGQFARGVVCISQFGIGVICLSQFAISAVSVAQFGIGIAGIAQFGLYLDGLGQFIWRALDAF